ncbi:aminotransferase class I/II-fold pyridoxal phosphate-dependent enzyme [Clostridium aminobutyricum]|uniref:Aminotransferase class I/II-fold pyridoxal phosphate-dependent enzyme n=1 Tax=Clostridium aminobutyricum TaxID=33953 RepID=A0A939IIB4_CLOAM|nr:aminotransferase class I/II-fold pyridoxal phosphate-dependent enzyme [Clostridium aminobutyricum]MBN7772901.1 aminotransferase class I/II-fold pyridoxal phosphate-dependent enzyme [Clostridium aminobutyricum]
MDQNRTPIFEAITKYIEKNPAYFRIPGHRFERGINKRWKDAVGENIFKYDLTEASMLDDLHNPEGTIKEAQDLASEVFGAEHSYFLVNGTTCGNEAMIMTTAFQGDQIAIPRNAHKSALMGLIIGGAEPLYIMPELSEEWGIQGGIRPEKVEELFQKNPNCKGILVVNPTYYGICSDLEGIAAVCHKYGATLLVDEAHGAHLYFSEQLPKGAIEQGADMCAQSIHKVTGSLTQSSMLHVKSKLVDVEKLEANLHIVQSTSPSYLLMTSLDMARQDLAINGRNMIDHAVNLAEYARTEINKIDGMVCLGKEVIGSNGIKDVDLTRLIISGKSLGITGFELAQLLEDEYNVDMELSDYINVLAIVTYANTMEDMERLVEALRKIAAKRKNGVVISNEIFLPEQPDYVISPRQAYFSKSKIVSWEEAKGKIAAEMIAPYPPGIPVIYPGERMTNQVWEYVESYRIRKRHLHGPADKELKTFKIIEE